MELGQHLEPDLDLDFGQVWMFGNVFYVIVLMFYSGCMYRSCYWWDAGVSVWKSWKVSSSIISYIIMQLI